MHMSQLTVKMDLLAKVNIIVDYVTVLREGPSDCLQTQLIASSHQNALRCAELLRQPMDLSPAHLSDYLNHHVRNLLTPVYTQAQFIELDCGDRLNQQQLSALRAISDEIRAVCASLKNLQNQAGSDGYRSIIV